MVWTYLKVFWFSKDNYAGHSARKKNTGRQKKRWEDNIMEWTRIDFASSTSAAEGKSRWKDFVVKHLWCPTTTKGYGID